MLQCNTAEIEKFERARSSHVIEKASRSGKAFSIVIFRVYDRRYISSPLKRFQLKKLPFIFFVNQFFTIDFNRKVEISRFSRLLDLY